MCHRATFWGDMSWSPLRLWPGRDEGVEGRERIVILGARGMTGCHGPPAFHTGLPVEMSMLGARPRPHRDPPEHCCQAPLLSARPLAGATPPVSELRCHLTHDKKLAVDTMSLSHRTKPAAGHPCTSAPDVTVGRDGVAGGRGDARVADTAAGMSGRPPVPARHVLGGPVSPVSQEEFGCFLKEKKTSCP